MAAPSDAEIKVTAELDDKVTAQIQELLASFRSLSEAQRKAFGDTAKAVDELGAAADKAGLSADKLKDKLKPLADGAKKAGDESEDAGDKAEKAGKAGADAFSSFAASLISFTAIVGTVIRDLRTLYTESLKLSEASARLANEFNKSNVEVGEVRKQIALLVDDFKFQVKESELLGIALQSVQDNLTDSATAANFAGNAFILARSANTDLATAYQTLADATRTFGLEADAAYDTANQLFIAQQAGAASLQDLRSAIVTIGPQAKQLGLSFSDAIAGITTLTQVAGFDGPKAIGALDRILDTLSKKQDDIAVQFARTGFSLQDVDVKTRGLVFALQNLRDGFAGNDAGLLKLLGTTEAYNAVVGLTGSNLAKAERNQTKLALGGGVLLTAFQNIQRSIGAGDLIAKFLDAPISAYADLVGALDNVGEGLTVLGNQARVTTARQQELRAEIVRTQREAQAASAAQREIAAATVQTGDAFLGAVPEVLQFRKMLEELPQVTTLAPLEIPDTATAQAELRRVEDVAQDQLDKLRELSEKFPVNPAAYNALVALIEKRRLVSIEEIKEAESAALQQQLDELSLAADERYRKEQELAAKITEKQREELEKRTKLEQDAADKRTTATQRQLDIDATNYRRQLDALLELLKRADEKRKNRIAGFQRDFQNSLLQSFDLSNVQLAQEEQVSALVAAIEPIALELAKLQEQFSADGILSEEEALQLSERFRTVQLSIRELADSGREGIEVFGTGFVAALQDRARKALDDFAQGVQLGEAVFDSFRDGLADALTAIVTGSKTASEAFKDFIRQFIINIVSAINQIIAFKIALAAINFLTAGASAASGGAGAEIAGSGGIAPPVDPGDFAIGGGYGGGGFEKGGIMQGRMLGSVPLREYAMGGIADGPQLALFGEGSTAEAFVPLPGASRRIPVEFSNGGLSRLMQEIVNERDYQPANQTAVQVSVEYAPSIQALDGRGAREVLLREARVIGDIVAAEVSSGANRGLVNVIRGRGGNA